MNVPHPFKVAGMPQSVKSVDVGGGYGPLAIAGSDHRG